MFANFPFDCDSFRRTVASVREIYLELHVFGATQNGGLCD